MLYLLSLRCRNQESPKMPYNGCEVTCLYGECHLREGLESGALDDHLLIRMNLS